MIPVTKTFLPPIQEYLALVQRAYDNHWLTNRGELVLELEQQLGEHLQIPSEQIIAMNNGTIPLQIALKVLGKQGEIITTPFSYVATTSAIIWEHCTPVFVDIHPEYWTIDESKLEAAITSKTTAILATHVYGNPCAVVEIERIAQKHGLVVIYDAAHAFGVTYHGKSIFSYGDVSTCSFHATKLFHTGEGGALFCGNTAMRDVLYYHHNFGHNGPLEFHGLGINGKISELQAAMGLAVLPYVEEIIQGRKKVIDFYDAHLDFEKLQKIKIREHTQWNYSYYPVLFASEAQLLQVQEALLQHHIFPRRYFYPALNQLPYVAYQAMPVAEDIASRVLCLPVYDGITELKIIVKIANENLKK